MALLLANGVSNYVTIPASASLNNLATGFYVVWIRGDVVPPAATRNIWGKSTGTDRVILNFTGTSIESTYAGSVTPCRGICTYANLPNFIQGQPVCLASRWVFGSLAANIYAGNDSLPLMEAASYTTQGAGSGSHDDSASNWIVGSDGTASTANAFPGALFSLQLFNRLPSGIDELQEIKNLWTPRRSGCVGAWRFGLNGTDYVMDESGSGNHGVVTGATNTYDYGIPRLRPVDKRIIYKPTVAVTTKRFLSLLGCGA